MPHPTRRGLLQGAAVVAGAGMLPVGRGIAAPIGLPQSAPVSVAAVGLLARDAPGLAAWYERFVGLQRLSADKNGVWLGAADVPLLEIIAAPGLEPAPAGAAGLFHTAFLLPARADLARWVIAAAQARFPVDGASDHLVSEAIYLTDPEGNGVEIYVDRPAGTWTWKAGQVEMATLPLDIEGLVADVRDGDALWRGAPAGTAIGHVHLKVGDAAKAGAWWQETLSFEPVRTRRGAVFLSTGGYHHHIAVNEWQSAGAGVRPPGQAGLAYVELKSRSAAQPSRHVDLWGTQIRIRPA